jgi:hypothetical protein
MAYHGHAQHRFASTVADPHLTNRWSQSLAGMKSRNVKLESRKAKRELALASGG